MPTFEYEALDKAGRKVRGVIEADSSDAVIGTLRDTGYYPTRVVPSTKKAGRPPATPGTGKPFFGSRAVVQPAARPGVVILHSRQLMMRWMAGGLYLFAFVMVAALVSESHSMGEMWGVGFCAAVGLVIAGILWTSPRRAEIDRTAGRLLVKPGVPNPHFSPAIGCKRACHAISSLRLARRSRRMHIGLRPARGDKDLISRNLHVFASKLVRNAG